jgi:hypothetical protein
LEPKDEQGALLFRTYQLQMDLTEDSRAGSFDAVTNMEERARQKSEQQKESEQGGTVVRTQREWYSDG